MMQTDLLYFIAGPGVTCVILDVRPKMLVESTTITDKFQVIERIKVCKLINTSFFFFPKWCIFAYKVAVAAVQNLCQSSAITGFQNILDLFLGKSFILCRQSLYHLPVNG